MIKKLLLLMVLLSLTVVITSCGDKTDTPKVKECTVCDNQYVSEDITYNKLPVYNPVTFIKDSLVKSSKSLIDGVDYNTYSYKLNSNKSVILSAIEVDLHKATIIGSTKGNKTALTAKSTLYSQIESVNSSGLNVIAGANADFFGSQTVNAFVKDGVIVKDSHNDNGGYDYKNVNHDIPASLPLLFGVSGTTAQIAPIVTGKTVEQTIKSKFMYSVHVRDTESDKVLKCGEVILNSFPYDSNNINILFKSSREASVNAGAMVIKLKRHHDSCVNVHGEVESTRVLETNEKLKASDDTFYIVVPPKFNISVKTGDVIYYELTTSDDTWRGFNTVIGGRQALVIDGTLPSTLALENSNGAQTTNVPRTAIGIKDDGKVMLVCVESLRYGKKSSSDSDPYGVNLKELADIMRYLGCVNAVNFDGGGSTQLIIKESGNYKVAVRSSDYGTYNLNDGRLIMNSIMVVGK